MKHSSSFIAVVIIAIVVAHMVSSQDAGTGNPTDTKQDIAANSLDTNPPGKTDTAVDTAGAAADSSPSATNVDGATAAENTDVPTEPVVNGGKNGGKNGTGKNGKPKRRRLRPRWKGRKRNGRRKPPKKNGQDKSIDPNENPSSTMPTSTPESQVPPDQAQGEAQQPDPQVQKDAQTPGKPDGQGTPPGTQGNTPTEQGPPPDTQGNTQTDQEPPPNTQGNTQTNKGPPPDTQGNTQTDQGSPPNTQTGQGPPPNTQGNTQKEPELQPNPDPIAQSQVDVQAQTDTQAQTQPDAAKSAPGPDSQAPPKQGTKPESTNKGAKEQKPPQTTQTKPSTTPPPKARAQALKLKPIVKADKSKGTGKETAADSASDQAWFQQFFDSESDQQTTTESSNAVGPPPSIEFNKKSKKVMPEVDAKAAKAYDGTPCNETYKPHESKYKYMMRFAEGVWGTLDCPPNLDKGLVWRQDLCSCGEELIAQDPNDWCAAMGFNPHPTNNHKYTRRHHGAQAVMNCSATLVWSQEKCLCMYDPTVQERPIESEVTFVCKKILHLEFEDTLKNSAEAYDVRPVSLKRRGKLPRIRYVQVPGATGKAAMIVSQPLEFLAFRGNDFQRQVTYSVNFKLSPRHLRRQNFMVLITDQCLENRGGPQMKKPGISLRFQPNTRDFHLEFRTEEKVIDEIVKGAEPDRNGWYKTVVYFEDNSLNLENNGKKLYSLTNLTGKIPQNKCPLYIAGRGQGFDRSQDFYGYIDNVQLIKDCTFHEANIKIL